MLDTKETDTSETPGLADLREAADRLAGDDLDRVFDDDLAESIVDLRRRIDGLEAEWLRRVAELDGRHGFEREGFASMASWLAARCRLGWGTARSRVALARALRSMPITAAAHATGDLDTRRVSHLVAAHNAHPGPFSADEMTLVEVATTLDSGELRRALDHWRQALDYDAALEDTNHLHQQRRLHISQTFAVMFRIDGDLDPEAGHIVMTALRAIANLLPVTEAVPPHRNSGAPTPSSSSAETSWTTATPRSTAERSRTSRSPSTSNHSKAAPDGGVISTRAAGSTPRRPDASPVMLESPG